MDLSLNEDSKIMILNVKSKTFYWSCDQQCSEAVSEQANKVEYCTLYLKLMYL